MKQGFEELDEIAPSPLKSFQLKKTVTALEVVKRRIISLDNKLGITENRGYFYTEVTPSLHNLSTKPEFG